MPKETPKAEHYVFPVPDVAETAKEIEQRNRPRVVADARRFFLSEAARYHANGQPDAAFALLLGVVKDMVENG